MKNNHNITIVVLGVTALVLLAMLIGNLLVQTPPAYADGAVRNGDFIMVNGAIGAGSDMIYVIHAPSKRLVAYFPTRTSNNRTIEIVDSLDLEQLFKSN